MIHSIAAGGHKQGQTWGRPCAGGTRAPAALSGHQHNAACLPCPSSIAGSAFCEPPAPCFNQTPQRLSSSLPQRVMSLARMSVCSPASVLLPCFCPHRNQRKKKALAETKSQFAKVADVNRSLTLQLEETQQESYEVTEHLRRELLDKTQKIVDLQNQLAKVRTRAMHTTGTVSQTCWQEGGCIGAQQAMGSLSHRTAPKPAGTASSRSRRQQHCASIQGRSNLGVCARSAPSVQSRITCALPSASQQRRPALCRQPTQQCNAEDALCTTPSRSTEGTAGRPMFITVGPSCLSVCMYLFVCLFVSPQTESGGPGSRGQEARGACITERSKHP